MSFSCRIGLLERMPILEKSSSGTALTNGDATQNDESEYGNGPMPQSLTNLMPAKEASYPCLVNEQFRRFIVFMVKAMG